MKIGILTQPLHSNYGGLLQCFALQTVLNRLGHKTWVVRRDYYGMKKISSITIIIHYIKQVVKFLLGRGFVKPYQCQINFVRKNTRKFISKYITRQTEHLTNNESLKKCHEKHKFDAYVVGSDQVWRPCYSPCITNYFLGFCSPNEKVKRVAYAASFGVDEWEFNEEDTKICRDLVQYFDAISVREDSAITLCEKYLNRNDALHVLDPTMLLEKEDYITLVEKEKEPKSLGNLFCYVLDESEEKEHVIKTIVKKTNTIPFTQMPKCGVSGYNLKYRLNDCVFPTVTAWLRAFMDAEMVVTDSFHGCVFSIIFNKPFWVIGNKERGMARFNSLLSIYGLEDRLITCDNLPSDFTRLIDWQKVNNIRKDWKVKSLNFLKNNL